LPFTSHVAAGCVTGDLPLEPVTCRSPVTLQRGASPVTCKPNARWYNPRIEHLHLPALQLMTIKIDIAKVRELRYNGQSMRAISKELGISRSTLQRYLQDDYYRLWPSDDDEEERYAPKTVKRYRCPGCGGLSTIKPCLCCILRVDQKTNSPAAPRMPIREPVDQKVDRRSRASELTVGALAVSES